MSSRSVYCPVHKRMFQMKGEIVLLANNLEQIHVKSCENEPQCTMMNHVECVVGKVLQTGKW